MSSEQPPLPGNERAQLNVRLDSAVKQTFQAECKRMGKEQNEVVEMLIETWLAPGKDRNHFHLDGVKCPMSALIDNLTECVRANVERRGP